MQRERDSLIPITEVIVSIDGPVNALPEAAPQAQRLLRPSPH